MHEDEREDERSPVNVTSAPSFQSQSSAALPVSVAVTEVSVSIVVYRPDMALLDRTLDTLAAASAVLRASAPGWRTRVVIVDNDDTSDTSDIGHADGRPDLSPRMARLREADIEMQLIAGHGNVGYGRGHNLAIDGIHADASRYHLILNPDVELEEQALVRALEFMEQHPEVGLLSPWIGDEKGHRQYLCRRYPTVFDLFIRGFMPQRIRRLFARRLARYEMRDVLNDTDIVREPPIVSGCFMLFRTDVLKKLGSFDPRYFLYFEDYDLSLRTHDVAEVAYVPAVRVMHYGGGAGRKGAAHIRMFVASAFRFFSRFGWKWV